MAKAVDHAPLFEKEVLILMGLNGLGGVPRVLALCQGYPGFLMEFCIGKTFLTMLSDTTPVSTLLRGIHNLVLRVREIHQAGYVHNDLKLDNVILEEGADSSVRARVIDLGLCTRLGEIPGFQGVPENHPHIAPELLRNGVASVESDVFSLGMMLKGVLQVHARSFPQEFELFHLAQAMTRLAPRERTPFQRCVDVLADNLDVPRQE